METCICQNFGKDGTLQHSGRLVRVSTSLAESTSPTWVCGNHIDAYLANLTATVGETLLHSRSLGDPAALRLTESVEQPSPQANS